MRRPADSMRSIGTLAVAGLLLLAGWLLAAAVQASAAHAITSAPNGLVRSGSGPTTNPHQSTAFGAGPVDGTTVGVNTDRCALCHRVHTASQPTLLASGSTQSDLCFTCHSSAALGSSTPVQSEYTAVSQTNDPASGLYYSHTAYYSPSPSTPHLVASTNEFAGVLNRHSECGDCHNPHQSFGTTNAAASGSNAWTPSYRLSGVSGLSVVNGAAGTAPTYTFVSGTGTPVTYEYQVCLKCHSGNTVLPPNLSGLPSRDILDIGIEFNPNNYSTHPIEAAGTNATPAMNVSLAGGTKWSTFTSSSTIRCSNCHANGAALASATDAGSNLAPHASAYKGILIANYDNGDPTLPAPGAAYAATDFTLCYLCHAASAYSPTGGAPGGAATNFKLAGGSNLHRLHVSGLFNKGGESGAGTSIDVLGDGVGNAVCAECHFQPHSTAFPTGGQANNSRLVAFAPNVRPLGVGAAPVFSANGGGGSCTLTCHGHEHSATAYP
ncbi:MAG: cytochrome c3 family protein [Actinomycetes bacterium]